MQIWGSKGKQELISEGKFFCPKCDNTRHYKKKRVPTGDPGEFIECQVCKSKFAPNILEPGTQHMAKMVAITKYSLLRGTPLTDVKSRLIKAGADDESVDEIIQKALSL
jgi:hypothetical protein